MKQPRPTQCILYAEDQPDDIFFLQYAFAKAGITHRLNVVTDGENAINYLAKAPPFTDRELHPDPCLILLDINLPKRNGHEVLQWIRSQPHFQPVPVVMLTSSNHPEDVKKARLFNADDYFVKCMKIPDMVKLANDIRARWLSQPPAIPKAKTRPRRRPSVRQA